MLFDRKITHYGQHQKHKSSTHAHAIQKSTYRCAHTYRSHDSRALNDIHPQAERLHAHKHTTTEANTSERKNLARKWAAETEAREFMRKNNDDKRKPNYDESKHTH